FGAALAELACAPLERPRTATWARAAASPVLRAGAPGGAIPGVGPGADRAARPAARPRRFALRTNLAPAAVSQFSAESPRRPLRWVCRGRLLALSPREAS